MEKIVERLFELQDLKFRDFHSRLVPNIDKESIIGVRTPQLRKLAKELMKEELRFEFMRELPHKYYEENVIHAQLAGGISKDIDEVIVAMEEFLPYVDNWAVCDTFAPKIFKKHPEKIYEKTKEWLKSEHIYTVRLGVVTQLQFFLDENFNPEMLDIMAEIKTDEYYINMAIAWYYSFALIKQYESTIPMFEKPVLSEWVHNKSIQKAIESYRISPETKAYLRSLKIKAKK